MHFKFLLSGSELDSRRMNRSFRSQVKVNVAGVGCNNQPAYHQTHGVALHAVCDSELDVPPRCNFICFYALFCPNVTPISPRQDRPLAQSQSRLVASLNIASD